jgi:epimerase transport system membrane fusion protein
MRSATTSVPNPSLASVLQQAAPEASGRSEIRCQLLRAAGPLLAAAALGLAWSGMAPLSGAVVAPAEVKVELNRKTVQHAEGGIVREILVRDGQAVRAGDALLVIGDLRGQAELALLHDQLRSARLRAARADAERLGTPRFEPPADLAADSQAAEHIARERAVFDARRNSVGEQVALLHDQLAQVQAQAAALESQIQATSLSARLSDEELAMNEKLVAQGFISRARLLGFQRVSADYVSRIGEHRSDLAAARQRASELRTRVAQLRLQQQTQATDELRDATAQVRELTERLRPSQDHVERQTVRAPVDGTVMALRVAGPGAVIAPREPLLDVVPAHEKLVIGARIATQDIEHVRVGSAAEVRLLGGDARRRPPLPARVVFVSADRMSDPAGARTWFEVTVEVERAALQDQQPPLQLQPGMPAEVYVTTAGRTLIEYLAKPFNLFTQRALREP